jgi:hypothetical protein
LKISSYGALEAPTEKASSVLKAAEPELQKSFQPLWLDEPELQKKHPASRKWLNQKYKNVIGWTSMTEKAFSVSD